MITSTFPALLEAAPDAMVIVDRDGKMVVVNGKVERLFGHTRAELVGQPVEMLVPARFRGRHPARRSQYMGEPRAREMGSGLELYAVRKDGTEFPVEISLSPLETPQGVVIISAIRDITERRRARQKDLLLREIHHRVKNNLQIISSLLKLHAERAPGAEAREAFEEAQLRVRAIALLHERLHEARQDGPVELEPYARALVASIVGVATGELQTEVHAAGVVLSLDQALPCGLIINELVTNSLKHAFPQETAQARRLTVLAERRGSGLALEVSDNGVGYPEKPREGSLGMHLVRTLVRQLRGTIKLSSVGGARAEVLFPAEERGAEP